MQVFLTQILNGLQLSMLVYLLAAGLTLIFGLMNILNLAHGAFFTLGAYCGVVVGSLTGSFWLALLAGPCCHSWWALVSSRWCCSRWPNAVGPLILTWHC
jgi:branched-subunit amino acid ABC-type transport system permease component